MVQAADSGHVSNPFREGPPAAALAPSLAAQGVFGQAEQARLVGEITARITVAQKFPRKPEQAMDLLLQDCERPTVAEHATYQYARGGTDISGASIKLVEATARRWGNIASGIKEVARYPGYSECVAYAWDLESGYYEERVFPVRHWRDTRGGGYALKDERDIAELILNIGQRRKRSVLEAILPADIIDMAKRKCELTLKATADTTPEGVQRILAAFAEFGVSKGQIEARIQRKMEFISAAQVVGLKRIWTSLNEGMSQSTDWFIHVEGDPPEGGNGNGEGEGEPAPAATGNEALKAAIKKGKKSGAPPAAAPPAAANEAGQPGDGGGAADAPATASEASGEPPMPSAAELRERVMKAPNRDAAWMVMDSVRSLKPGLSPQDHESLVSLIEQRFPDGD